MSLSLKFWIDLFSQQKQYEKSERVEGGKEKGEGVKEKGEGVKEKCVTRIMLNAPSQSQIRYTWPSDVGTHDYGVLYRVTSFTWLCVSGTMKNMNCHFLHYTVPEQHGHVFLVGLHVALLRRFNFSSYVFLATLYTLRAMHQHFNKSRMFTGCLKKKLSLGNHSHGSGSIFNIFETLIREAAKKVLF